MSGWDEMTPEQARELERELDELEEQDPEDKAARIRLDRAKEEIIARSRLERGL